MRPPMLALVPCSNRPRMTMCVGGFGGGVRGGTCILLDDVGEDPIVIQAEGMIEGLVARYLTFPTRDCSC
jgi:hypothetical protein